MILFGFVRRCCCRGGGIAGAGANSVRSPHPNRPLAAVESSSFRFLVLIAEEPEPFQWMMNGKYREQRRELFEVEPKAC